MRRNVWTTESTSLGVDIGSRAMKLLLLRQNGARLEILGATSVDLPPGMVNNGIVNDPKALSAIVSAQVDQFEARPHGGVVSIPSNLAALRWISLPALSGDELRQAARFKVKRHLPFPVANAYVDATQPELDETGVSGQSLVIAVPKEVIHSRAVALELAGVPPLGAELEAQAILRVVDRRLNQQSFLWRDASLTIIDVGGSNTHMYVVQNQKLQFIRGVPFGSNLIAQAVADALEITREEAEEAIGDRSAKLSSAGTIALTVHDSPVIVNVQAELEKITKEFTRLLRYFRSLHPERSYAGILDHLILCGGLSGLIGFPSYLQESLGLRVELARPLAGTFAQLKPETFQNVSSRQEAFTVVMGLALAGLEKKLSGAGVIHAEREFVWARDA